MAAPSRSPTPPGDRPPSLPETVLSRGRETPEEPALFYPDGLDVRWHSWGDLAEQVAGGAAALAALALPGGSRVALRWRTEPDAVAADLAIQAVGLVAVPVTAAAEAVSAGSAAWLLGPDAPAPEGDLPAARLPEARRWPGGRPSEVPEAWPATGGVWVTGAGSAESGAELGADPGVDPRGGRVVDPPELSERVRDLRGRLERAAAGAEAVVPGAGRAPRSRRAGRREIAVASFDLRAADGRTFLAWSLVVGAALFLEPDPRILPGSVEWARPTLAAGEARALAELGRRLRSREEARPRFFRRRSRAGLPFGRLRLLLVLGTGRLAVDDVAFWAGRGVAVVRVGS